MHDNTLDVTRIPLPTDTGPTFPAAPAPPALPGYELLGELGRGAMGVVYLARHLALDRHVALKLVLSGPHAGEHELARFRREAEAIARLRHPNIVQIYEVGEQAGLPFFSLEYCEGGTLEKALAPGPLLPLEAARLLEELARAMQAAHDAGVVHRDLKPANVLLADLAAELRSARDGATQRATAPSGARRLDDLVPKIADFGLARRIDQVGQTRTGTVLGTPAYMAPEQAEGKARDLGPAVDVYALGAILYECLTGRPPFLAASVMDTLLQAIHDEAVPPRRLQPTVPRDLETICLKCLAKAPERRYATARALAEDLARFRAGETIVARPVGPFERGARWVRRRPAVAGLLLALVLLGAAAGGLVAWQYGIAVAERDRARIQEGVALEKEADALEQKRLAQRERTNALRQKRAAVDSAAEARLAEGRARAALESARRELFAGKVPLARASFREGNVGLARDLLLDVPPRLRFWEWNFAQREIVGGLFALDVPASPLSGVAFSPDGRLLATSSADGRVRLWRAATGEALRTLPGHAGGALCVAFRPDGQLLASGGEDRAVRLWDVRTGKERFALEGHDQWVTALAFRPDGRRLASGGRDGQVRVWDGRTDVLYRSFRTDGGEITGLAFSPDGARLGTASRSGTVRVWDESTGAHKFQTSAPEGASGLAFSPDGVHLASGWRAVHLWNARTGALERTFPAVPTAITGVAFRPDGERLAASGADGIVRLWDVRTGAEALVLRGHTGAVRGLAFSPDGQRLATVGRKPRAPGGEARVWDARDGAASIVLHHSKAVSVTTAFSLGGRFVAVHDDDVLRAGDARTGAFRVLVPVPPQEVLSSLAIGPGGAVVAWGTRRGACFLADARTGVQLGRWQGHDDEVLDLAFSPDGKWLASGSADRKVKIWSARTGALRLALAGHKGWASAVCFSPDGSRLASGGRDRTVKVWDAQAGDELLSLSSPSGFVTSVAFGARAGGDLALAAAFGGPFRDEPDGEVRVWDGRTGAPRFAIKGHTGEVRCLAFSPDGERLVSAGDDRALKVWDVEGGGARLTLPGHAQPVGRLAFSRDGRQLLSAGGGTILVWPARVSEERVNGAAFGPEGRRLATAGQDGIVKVWDVQSATALLSLAGHSGGATVVAFSPDGKRLASAAADGTVLLWEARTGAQLKVLPGHGAIVTSLTFAPDGQLLASTSRDRTIRLWRLRGTEGPTTLPGHQHWVECAAFSADGRSLVSGSWDGEVRVWDVRAGVSRVLLPRHDAGVSSVAFRGATVHSTDVLGRSLVRALKEGSVLRDEPGAPPSAVVRTPDGRCEAHFAGAGVIVQTRRPLDAAERAARALATRFDPSWHAEQARRAAGRRNWFALDYHLGQLSAPRPDSL